MPINIIIISIYIYILGPPIEEEHSRRKYHIFPYLFTYYK